MNHYEQAELNELEDQAQFLREWADDRREEDYVPYPLANVLKPNPWLLWALACGGWFGRSAHHHSAFAVTRNTNPRSTPANDPTKQESPNRMLEGAFCHL